MDEHQEHQLEGEDENLDDTVKVRFLKEQPLSEIPYFPIALLQDSHRQRSRHSQTCSLRNQRIPETEPSTEPATMSRSQSPTKAILR